MPVLVAALKQPVESSTSETMLAALTKPIIAIATWRRNREWRTLGCRRDDHQADQQPALEGRKQPVRADGHLLRERELKRDRARDHELRLPERQPALDHGEEPVAGRRAGCVGAPR